MKARLVLLLGCLASLLSAGTVMAEEGPVVIHNKYLEVRADRKTGEVTIFAKGKPILTKVRIGTGRLRDQDCHHQLRGPWVTMAVKSTFAPLNLETRSVSIPDCPFALVAVGIGNRTNAPMTLNKAAVFRGISALIKLTRRTQDTRHGRALATGQADRQLHVADSG